MDDQHNQNYSFTLVAPGFEIASGKDIYQSSNLLDYTSPLNPYQTTFLQPLIGARIPPD